MHKVNVGISWDHPKKGQLYHLPGEVVDLSDWPPEDITKMESEGTIEPVVEKQSAADTPGATEPRRSRRTTDGEGS